MRTVHNVLFLGTANSTRSIMAEALLNMLGAPRFVGFSAGQRPAGTVHPMALDALHRAGCDTRGMRSKALDEFMRRGAPPLDFVITVCEHATAFPALPGWPFSTHWGLGDPAAFEGSDALRREAFAVALSTLRRRVQHLTSLPFDSVDAFALRGAVSEIGTL